MCICQSCFNQMDNSSGHHMCSREQHRILTIMFRASCLFVIISQIFRGNDLMSMSGTKRERKKLSKGNSIRYLLSVGGVKRHTRCPHIRHIKRRNTQPKDKNSLKIDIQRLFKAISIARFSVVGGDGGARSYISKQYSQNDDACTARCSHKRNNRKITWTCR